MLEIIIGIFIILIVLFYVSVMQPTGRYLFSLLYCKRKRHILEEHFHQEDKLLCRICEKTFTKAEADEIGGKSKKQ